MGRPPSTVWNAGRIFHILVSQIRTRVEGSSGVSIAAPIAEGGHRMSEAGASLHPDLPDL